MPEDKEVQIELQGIRAEKGLVVVQELFQQAIDPFQDTAGATGGSEQSTQFLCHVPALGILSKEGLQGGFCFLGFPAKREMPIDEGLLQAPMTGRRPQEGFMLVCRQDR